MQSTVRNFWKMVYECNCSVIVMTSDLIEGGQEASAQYVEVLLLDLKTTLVINVSHSYSTDSTICIHTILCGYSTMTSSKRTINRVTKIVSKSHMPHCTGLTVE